MLTISIIVACDPNYLIGTEDNKIPWNLPKDLEFFKQTTLNSPIIMGRKTWDSLPRKPLPKRFNFVVSRTVPSDPYATITQSKPLYVPNIEKAVSMSASLGFKNAFIIGGAQIYKNALETGLVNKIIMTKVKKIYQGNVYFPNPEEYGYVPLKEIEQNDDFIIVEYQKCK